MRRLALLCSVIVLGACGARERRIRKNQGLFSTYPPATQQAIRRGDVEVGFTKEMVLMALGKPDRVYSRSTEGSTQEIWGYGAVDGVVPGVGVAVGAGTGVLSGGYGGVSVGGISRTEERTRVVFEGDRVVETESCEK